MWIGGVRVIVPDQQGRILMVCQHHEEKDIWMVPGGGIEAGESSTAAAVREMQEETGLTVEVLCLLWHVEEVSIARGQRFVNFFLARKTGGTAQLGADPELDEHHQVLRELRYVSREEMAELQHVYPAFLPVEIWDILDQTGSVYHEGVKQNILRQHEVYRIREA